MTIYSPIIKSLVLTGEKVVNHLARDFGELENLQVSHNSAEKFTRASFKRVRDIIFRNLSKAHPDINFKFKGGKELILDENSNSTWLIDVIGGSRNLEHAIRYCATSIALQRKNKDGELEIVAGAIIDPIFNEIYFAEKGIGAYCGNRRVRVSSRNKVPNILAAFNPSKESFENTLHKKVLNNINTEIGGRRYNRCTALDLAYVASGRYDASVNLGRDYCETAAGILIVKEAGGFVTDLNNENIKDNPDIVIASNSKVHKELLAVLNQ